MSKSRKKERKAAEDNSGNAGSKKPRPWDDAHPKVRVNFSTTFPEKVDMQMTFLIERIPKLSKQKIVREAVGLYLAQKLGDLGELGEL
ncbi:hypothetical protein [Paraburkholderia hospita]|uniref:hypothetical protein n=1 Tax=Paraburkholderia hospita TaxID=169430 RepID=UPI001260158B|nr:hypothetical protein [Paraburkholderia hospita]